MGKFILNTKTNSALEVITENENYYQLSDNSFVLKDNIASPNSQYKVIGGETTSTQSTPSSIKENLQPMDDVMGTMLNAKNQMWENLAHQMHNGSNNIQQKDYNMETKVSEPTPYMGGNNSDLDRRMREREERLQREQMMNRDSFQQVQQYDNQFANIPVADSPSGNNHNPQHNNVPFYKDNKYSKKITLPVYSNMYGFGKTEYSVLDVFENYMKPEKRNQKLPITFHEVFNIPRSLNIASADEMNDLSFVDYIANFLVNEMFEKRDVLVDLVKEKILKVLPEYDEYGGIIQKDIASIIQQDNLTPLSEIKKTKIEAIEENTQKQPTNTIEEKEVEKEVDNDINNDINTEIEDGIIIGEDIPLENLEDIGEKLSDTEINKED